MVTKYHGNWIKRHDIIFADILWLWILKFDPYAHEYTTGPRRVINVEYLFRHSNLYYARAHTHTHTHTHMHTHTLTHTHTHTYIHAYIIHTSHFACLSLTMKISSILNSSFKITCMHVFISTWYRQFQFHSVADRKLAAAWHASCLESQAAPPALAPTATCQIHRCMKSPSIQNVCPTGGNPEMDFSAILSLLEIAPTAKEFGSRSTN